MYVYIGAVRCLLLFVSPIRHNPAAGVALCQVQSGSGPVSSPNVPLRVSPLALLLRSKFQPSNWSLPCRAFRVLDCSRVGLGHYHEEEEVLFRVGLVAVGSRLHGVPSWLWLKQFTSVTNPLSCKRLVYEVVEELPLKQIVFRDSALSGV